MTGITRLRLAISSRRTAVEGLQTTVDAFLRRHGLGDEARRRVEVAVGEAVGNAIVHGHREDPRKQVRLAVELDGRQLLVRVHDDGAGFDGPRSADPRAPERRFAPGGRGFLLMRQAMDEVHHRPRPGGGTTVTMRAFLSAGDIVATSTSGRGGSRAVACPWPAR
ncbi:ATP-binding protein [Nannocystis radixulma]|uniref:ATP-binding protein n=1 Tax=Nannocystis radixulma TaxID=2995305 RepID=A0ABT5BRS2_9BACT|nr:ATP-binding protein [Nannocystis radixulma]MDC0675682.1 ATP-binding protein [Nannocystis radixulma]